MPWSPIPKFPEIVSNLKSQGYTHQVGIEILKTELMRVLGLTGDKSLRRTIYIMDRLGYIKDTGKGAIFYVCQDRPGDFPQARRKEDEEEMDKYGV